MTERLMGGRTNHDETASAACGSIGHNSATRAHPMKCGAFFHTHKGHPTVVLSQACISGPTQGAGTTLKEGGMLGGIVGKPILGFKESQ